MVNSLLRERYPINYIYGFQARGFSYFLTVQKTAAEGLKPYQSKLGKSTATKQQKIKLLRAPEFARTHRNRETNQFPAKDKTISEL